MENYSLPPTGPPQASPEPTNCQTETGELCVYHTVFSAVTTNQATTTSTKTHSACATVLGCEATDDKTSTSTTVTGSATKLTYAIYPSDGRDEAQVTAIAQQLQTFVDDPADLQSSETDTFEFNYWQLPLNESSVTKIRDISNVSLV